MGERSSPGRSASTSRSSTTTRPAAASTSRSTSTTRPAGAGRAGAGEGNAAVPPADGVRGGEPTIRHFERALGRRASGSGPPPAGRDRQERRGVRAAAAHLSARAARAERLLQPAGRRCSSATSRPTEDDPATTCPAAWSSPACRTTSSRTRPRTPCSTGMHRYFIERDQPRRARVPRGVRRHRGAVPALHVSRRSCGTRSRRPAATSEPGEPARPAGQPVRPHDRRLRGALRDAIGKRDRDTGEWQPHKPDPADYDATVEPHERGAILVAAVFDAFLSIYTDAIGDLLRIATRRHRRAASPERSTRTSSPGWPTRPPSRPSTCSRCASARSTTARRSTSPSASSCAP